MASELQHSPIFRVKFEGRGVLDIISANANIAHEEGVSMAIEERKRWLQRHVNRDCEEVSPKNRVVLVGGAAATVEELRRVVQDEFSDTPSSKMARYLAAGGHQLLVVVVGDKFSARFGVDTCWGKRGPEAAVKVKQLLPPSPPILEQSVEPDGSGIPVANRPTVSGNSSGPSATLPKVAKSAVAAAASFFADPPLPDCLSSFSVLAISPAASPGSTTTPVFAMRPIDSMQPPVSTHRQRFTFSHSQEPSAAESLTNTSALPRDDQLQAPPCLRSSQALQRPLDKTRCCAHPILTVDVQCTRLSDVKADAYILPTSCEADFTRALSGSYGIFVAVPDRSKLGESAEKLLYRDIHAALTKADVLGFCTVAMLPIGVYYGAFAPNDAAQLTYGGILAFCQAREEKPHVRRLIVAVPDTDLLKVYKNAFSCGFDVPCPCSEKSVSKEHKRTPIGELRPDQTPIDPVVYVTLCGTTSGVLKAVSRLVEKVVCFKP